LHDSVHRDAVNLATLSDTLDHEASANDLVSKLESVDVHELARLTASWVDRIGKGVSRRSLLLKLSAGLSLAAASPALADDHVATVSAASADGEFSGVWHSQYVYPSTGRGGDFTGEHYVTIRRQGERLLDQSVPATSGSVLNLDLVLAGSVATGTWSERTSPTGYYRGVVYHGAIQLVIDPMGKTMTGKWIGFDREFAVNSGEWSLRWQESATTKGVQRAYHLKV
jgi:hypothetical protein